MDPSQCDSSIETYGSVCCNDLICVNGATAIGAGGCNCGASACAEGSFCLTGDVCTTHLGEWTTEVTGECNKSCAGGMGAVTHSCVSKEDGLVLGDEACDAALMPTEETGECNADVPCTYDWHTELSECSSTCRGGTQQPTVTCVLTGTDVVSDGMCNADDEPSSAEVACNEDVPCVVAKSKNTYGGVSMSMFQEKRGDYKKSFADTAGMDDSKVSEGNVEAVLRRRLNGGVSVEWIMDLDTLDSTAVDSLLTTLASDTFSETLKSNTVAATGDTITTVSTVDESVYVEVPDYTGVTCTSTCEGGTQTTTVHTCVLEGTTTTVSNDLCDDAADMSYTQDCNAGVTCEYVWVETDSACSSTCAGGKQTPTVSCVLKGTDTVAENSMCVADEEPTPAEVDCNADVTCPEPETTVEETEAPLEDGVSQLCLLAVVFVMTMILF